MVHVATPNAVVSNPVIQTTRIAPAISNNQAVSSGWNAQLPVAFAAPLRINPARIQPLPAQNQQVTSVTTTTQAPIAGNGITNDQSTSPGNNPQSQPSAAAQTPSHSTAAHAPSTGNGTLNTQSTSTGGNSQSQLVSAAQAPISSIADQVPSIGNGILNTQSTSAGWNSQSQSPSAAQALNPNTVDQASSMGNGILIGQSTFTGWNPPAAVVQAPVPVAVVQAPSIGDGILNMQSTSTGWNSLSQPATAVQPLAAQFGSTAQSQPMPLEAAQLSTKVTVVQVPSPRAIYTGFPDALRFLDGSEIIRPTVSLTESSKQIRAVLVGDQHILIDAVPPGSNNGTADPSQSPQGSQATGNGSSSLPQLPVQTVSEGIATINQPPNQQTVMLHPTSPANIGAAVGSPGDPINQLPAASVPGTASEAAPIGSGIGNVAPASGWGAAQPTTQPAAAPQARSLPASTASGWGASSTASSAAGQPGMGLAAFRMLHPSEQIALYSQGVSPFAVDPFFNVLRMYAPSFGNFINPVMGMLG